MKRTAASFVMLAGLGCASLDGQSDAKPFGQASVGKEITNVVGPTGEPVHIAAAGQMPTDKAKPKAGVVRADLKTTGSDSGVRQAAGFARVDGGYGGSHTPGLGMSAFGPATNDFRQSIGHGGVLPVPFAGPPGAVAAVGTMGPIGGMYGPMYANQRTSIRFASPQGMMISWQGPGGTFPDTGLQAPGRYNFPQGATYRLKLGGLVKYPTRAFYPTIEVYPATPATVTYLSHNAVPVSFTDEDFEQVNAGNLVIKVIYLPNAAFQDLPALAGADEIVSTRLEPGVNPVDEANRRGTILAVIRMGNIDLEDKFGPPVDAPTGVGVPVMPPAIRMTTPPPATPRTLPGATPIKPNTISIPELP
jgi:hypothetical protein